MLWSVNYPFHKNLILNPSPLLSQLALELPRELFMTGSRGPNMMDAMQMRLTCAVRPPGSPNPEETMPSGESPDAGDVSLKIPRGLSLWRDCRAQPLLPHPSSFFDHEPVRPVAVGLPR